MDVLKEQIAEQSTQAYQRKMAGRFALVACGWGAERWFPSGGIQ
jgi:hypothetical protein